MQMMDLGDDIETRQFVHKVHQRLMPHVLTDSNVQVLAATEKLVLHQEFEGVQQALHTITWPLS